MSSLEALPAVPHASPSLQALSQVATQAAAGELPSQPHPIDADAGALLGLQAVGALPVGALPVGALPLPPLAAAAVDHDQNAPMVPSSAAAAPPAVSSEWHVHCVKEVPSPAADGQTRQLCIQCPNGRRHSSIFLVNLFPHWLNPSYADKSPTDEARMARYPFKDVHLQHPSGGLVAEGPDKVVVKASLSHWVTGEWYPDAVVFNNHPNGHLQSDSSSASVLFNQNEGPIKLLLKIRRPADPHADPSTPDTALALSALSSLKLTLHATFYMAGQEFSRDFVSPGLIKVVSRVVDKEASARGKKRTRPSEPNTVNTPDAPVATLAQSNTMPVVMDTSIAGVGGDGMGGGMPAGGMAGGLLSASGGMGGGLLSANGASTFLPNEAIFSEANAQHLFLYAYQHNPALTLGTLGEVLAGPAGAPLPAPVSLTDQLLSEGCVAAPVATSQVGAAPVPPQVAVPQQLPPQVD